jgi:hypothetical protein
MNKNVILIFFAVVSYLLCQIQEQDLDKLIKILKKKNKSAIKSKNCISNSGIDALFKRLASLNRKKREKAYEKIKEALLCNESREFIQKNLNKAKPTARYLIMNSAYQLNIILDKTALERDKGVKPQQWFGGIPPTTAPMRYERYIRKKELLSIPGECTGEDDNLVIPAVKRVARKECFHDKEKCSILTGKRKRSLALPNCQKAVSLTYLDKFEYSEVVEYFFECLYEFIGNMKMMEARGEQVVKFFRRNLTGFATVFYSHYKQFQEMFKKEDEERMKTSSWLTLREKFEYVEAVFLYSLTLTLRRSTLLENILLSSFKNKSFLKAVFLSLPYFKFKNLSYAYNLILNNLSSAKIMEEPLLLQEFMCIYNKVERTCKKRTFKKIDFKKINPISDFDKVAAEIKKCL